MADDLSDCKQSDQFVAEKANPDSVLAFETAGLVNLSDYKIRRAKAIERKEQEAQHYSNSLSSSRSSTPGTSQPQKKKRKLASKSKLSFGLDDDVEDASLPSSAADTTRSSTPANDDVTVKRRLGPNSSVGTAPKVITKTSMVKDAETRERLRKDFLIMQEAVKATEILIPFVFYDGTNIPGGVCKMKKGDPIWLFLDRSRKVGAELGVGGADKSRREWARVGVDDLMLVRGDMIIPHHYDFYYFISNATQGFQGPLFEFSDNPIAGHTVTRPSSIESSNGSGLNQNLKNSVISTSLEGADQDPTHTKVVDRRWYERHKHIYPSSIWEEFDPNKTYMKGTRKDPKGNAFFF